MSTRTVGAPGTIKLRGYFQGAELSEFKKDGTDIMVGKTFTVTAADGSLDVPVDGGFADGATYTWTLQDPTPVGGGAPTPVTESIGPVAVAIPGDILSLSGLDTEGKKDAEEFVKAQRIEAAIRIAEEARALALKDRRDFAGSLWGKKRQLLTKAERWVKKHPRIVIIGGAILILALAASAYLHFVAKVAEAVK